MKSVRRMTGKNAGKNFWRQKRHGILGRKWPIMAKTFSRFIRLGILGNRAENIRFSAKVILHALIGRNRRFLSGQRSCPYFLWKAKITNWPNRSSEGNKLGVLEAFLNSESAIEGVKKGIFDQKREKRAKNFSRF